MEKMLFIMLLLCMTGICKAITPVDSLYGIKLQRSFIEALEKDVVHNREIRAGLRISLIEDVTLYYKRDYNTMSVDTLNLYMGRLSGNMKNDSVLLALYDNCKKQKQQLEQYELARNALSQKFDPVRVAALSNSIKSILQTGTLSEPQKENLRFIDSLLTLFPREVDKMMSLFDIKDEKCKSRLKVYAEMTDLDASQLMGFTDSFLVPYYEKTNLNTLTNSKIPFITMNARLIQDLLKYMQQEGKEPGANGVAGGELLHKFLEIEFELSSSHKK